MEKKYNMKSPAVKRLMREAQELCNPTEEYYAQPVDDNLFEWHFTVRGPSDSDFEGGVYHGRIILPPDYPMKPPNLIIFTPNGRFETNKKICLSISGHHPESWQPSWSIRTALVAIIGFMPTESLGAIGSLEYAPEERRKLAKKSLEFSCDTCGLTSSLLSVPSTSHSSSKINQEARDLAAQISFKGERNNTNNSEQPLSMTENIPPNNQNFSSSTPSPTVNVNNVNNMNNSNVNLTQSSNESWSGYVIAAIIAVLAFLIFRRWWLM